MKMLIIILSLISLTATAADKNSSWAEIQNDWDLETHEAKINFSGTFVSVFDVCHINEIELKTKKPITVYEWVSDDRHEAVGKEYKSRSIKYTKVVVDGDGTREEDAEYALSYKVDVSTDSSEGHGRFLFSKLFTIPACL